MDLEDDAREGPFVLGDGRALQINTWLSQREHVHNVIVRRKAEVSNVGKYRMVTLIEGSCPFQEIVRTLYTLKIVKYQPYLGFYQV